MTFFPFGNFPGTQYYQGIITLTQHVKEQKSIFVSAQNHPIGAKTY
jgi:hypothetical protein